MALRMGFVGGVEVNKLFINRKANARNLQNGILIVSLNVI